MPARGDGHESAAASVESDVMRFRWLLLILLCIFTSRFADCSNAAADQTNWLDLWTREPGAGSSKVDAQVKHAGRETLRVQYTGTKDWSLPQPQHVATEAGDIFQLRTAVRVEGAGSVSVSVIAFGPGDQVVDWYLGRQTVSAGADWQDVTARIVIPTGVVAIQPRVTGDGPSVAHIDGLELKRTGNLASLRPKGLPKMLELSNSTLRVSLDTSDLTLHVSDLRDGKRFDQQAANADCVVTSATGGKTIELTVLAGVSGDNLHLSIAMEKELPELVVKLAGKGALDKPVALPAPFVSPAGSYLVLPMNEGISFPAEDVSQAGRRMEGYSSHGMCMAFAGVTDGDAGQMQIIQTPDDAAIRLIALDHRLAIAPEWDAQKGKFGYERSIRYVFFDHGGHVAMAKRYRAYAQEIGLLKTLAEKRKTKPDIDLLVGAPNVWCWEEDGPRVASELQAAGISRMLWSNQQPPEHLKRLNAMPGVLTSRYDIYQDLMDPAKFNLLKWTHPDWTTAGWPKDLLIDSSGNWEHGWEIETNAGGMMPCGVLCDLRAPDFARKRIGKELSTHPYHCRFIDTTTATPWRECYSPDHPMTRSDSRAARMQLLQVVSDEFHLVTGSETGHDAAVPFVDYFEGMLSLIDYRVPDAGREMQRIWDAVPEDVAKYQVGQQYRLPLWELVYHDCVVAQWYWGDYNNKLPITWDKRDLFNVLYGTPPMFMFDASLWQKQKERFVASYRNTCQVARACGYSEMTDHRFLTPDRNVQQTKFANGVDVTVNFGQTPFTTKEGQVVKPMGYAVNGLLKSER